MMEGAARRIFCLMRHRMPSNTHSVFSGSALVAWQISASFVWLLKGPFAPLAQSTSSRRLAILLSVGITRKILSQFCTKLRVTAASGLAFSDCRKFFE